MKNSILLQNLSSETLKELIKESVKSQLDDFKKDLQTHNPDELLTRDDVLDLLQIDSSTLWRYQNDGKIKAYGIGNRRYYKKAELINALKPLKK